MMRAAIIAVCVIAAHMDAFAADQSFRRDLSAPFLRDDDDDFLRERDLPGPLRKTWPYKDMAEFPFKAVEARRACHARALFEIGEIGGAGAKADARLASERDGALLFRVTGRYDADFDGERKSLSVMCEISSREVRAFSLSE